eukprot:CAMPEP_0195127736 /NCGR_PEP_ID=MMETSP0448-20130528/137652_1 /TAXON_ID=66468 /ORGANISM="Heterocapsa triquestra, Strain CCMP 448" /LENGTH=30 /DNA_ID= /DNA_START= /DNA_END= /DNA_ORIENTATION=
MERGVDLASAISASQGEAREPDGPWEQGPR